MTRRSQPLPLALQSSSFRVTRDGASGVAHDRFRRGDIEHPFHGVAAHAVELTDLGQLCFAYSHVMSARAAFSHTTSALLRNLPLPLGVPSRDIEVTLLGDGRAPRGRGVRGHRWHLPESCAETMLVTSSSTGELLPLRVLTPEATIVTLARRLELPDLVAVVDAARTLAPLDHRAQVPSVLQKLARGKPGSSRLRRALALSRQGSRSRPETLLRLMLTRAGLPEPEIAWSAPVGGGAHEADLAWPTFGVVLEYEGDVHRIDRRQFRSDIRRFDAYLDAGLSPIRATGDDVFLDPEPLLSMVERRLRSRGWVPLTSWRRRAIGPSRR